MTSADFDYPSEIVNLVIWEHGRVQSKQRSIHRSVLVKLPYFSKMLSEVWHQEPTKPSEFELPVFSNSEDFDKLIKSLYCLVPLAPARDPERAVGILVLVKMLLAKEQEEVVTGHLRLLTTSNGHELADLVQRVDAVGSLDHVAQSLKGIPPTFDDLTLINVIHDCRNSSHASLVGVALRSRGSVGLGEQDTMTLLRYMNTESGELKHLPFLKLGQPEHRGSKEWAEKVRNYPLCLQATGNFKHLWNIVRFRIFSQAHFLEAVKIFTQLVYFKMTVFETPNGGYWSNSGKTYYPAAKTVHWITPTTLIPHTEPSNDSVENEPDEAKDERTNSLVDGLVDLLDIGAALVQSRVISIEDLITLVDCASPKIKEVHSCSNKICRGLRKPVKSSGVALTDDQLSAFLEKLNRSETVTKSMIVAKHLLNSDRWGLKSLGPKTIVSVQKSLAP